MANVSLKSPYNWPASLNCTMSTAVYPSGTLSFTDTPWWKENSGQKRTFQLYLCDSSGNNRAKLTPTFSINGSGRVYTPTSFSIAAGATGLAGKAIYMTAYVGNSVATQFAEQHDINGTMGTATQTWTLTTTKAGNGSGTVTAGGNLAYGATKTLTASASTGSTFKSWSKTAGTLSSTTSTSTVFTMGTSNATVTGSFTLNSYTLTTKTVGSGSVTGGGTMGYHTTKKLTASPTTGHSFSSWKVSGTGSSLSSTSSNPTTFTMGTANATVTASFALTSYSLTTQVSPSGSGTVTGGGTMGYGTTKKLEASPSTGYGFTSWSTTAGTLSSASNATTTFTMGTSNATVTGSFTKIIYNITTDVIPSGAGTITPSSATATYGDTITLSQTSNIGYGFDGYTTDPEVTIANNTFSMPASDIAITGNYHILKSEPSLNKSTYSGGDTATLTLTVYSSSFTHRYKLSFGEGMETSWISLAAGITSTTIYIPIEWSLHLGGATSVSGGTLVLETFSDGTSIGTNTINNLTYQALNDTIPSLSVWRKDSQNNATIVGTYVGYSVTVPSSITNYNVSYDTEPLSLDNNHDVVLSMTYGSETITITRDIPKVVVVKKCV